jgi:hypothetical protein
MTDDELCTYCGLAAGDPLRAKFIASLTPLRRALFERMREVEIEAELWAAGRARLEALKPSK